MRTAGFDVRSPIGLRDNQGSGGQWPGARLATVSWPTTVPCNVSETRRGIGPGPDDDGVIHRALFPQGCHGLRDGGRALPDGTINAQHILVALVEDGVDRDGGLARLAVAEN